MEHREFCIRPADSPLLQWFLQIGRVDKVKGVWSFDVFVHINEKELRAYAAGYCITARQAAPPVVGAVMSPTRKCARCSSMRAWKWPISITAGLTPTAPSTRRASTTTPLRCFGRSRDRSSDRDDGGSGIRENFVSALANCRPVERNFHKFRYAYFLPLPFPFPLPLFFFFSAAATSSALRTLRNSADSSMALALSAPS